jgi:hypothetical protein
MAAQTEIDICNAALALLGEAPITGFNADTNAERQCELLYDMSRDAVLRGHPWNFAEKYVELAPLTETPPFEYDYYYQLPTDCVRALRLVDTNEAWRIVEGRKIATSASPANLVYTAAITTVPYFDAQFTQAVIYHLAAQMAIALPNKASLHVQLMQMYDGILRMAKTADGQEGTPIAVKYNTDYKLARSTFSPQWWPRRP